MKNEKVNPEVVENSTKGESKQIASSNETAKASEGKQNAGSSEIPKADKPTTQQGSSNTASASAGNAEANEREEMMKLIMGMKEQLNKLEREKNEILKNRKSWNELQELSYQLQKLKDKRYTLSSTQEATMKLVEKLVSKDDFDETEIEFSVKIQNTKVFQSANKLILNFLFESLIDKLKVSLEKFDAEIAELEKYFI